MLPFPWTETDHRGPRRRDEPAHHGAGCFFAFPQAPGARSARLATRLRRAGAVAPAGPLRGPVPLGSDARLAAGGTQAAPPCSPSPPPSQARGASARRLREMKGRRRGPGRGGGGAPARVDARRSAPRGPVPLNSFLLSLRRRALAPLAWLTRLRRAGAVAPAGPLRGPVPLGSDARLAAGGTQAAPAHLSLSLSPQGGGGQGEVGVVRSAPIPSERIVLYPTPGSASCGSPPRPTSAAAASSAGHSCASMFQVCASAARSVRSQMS